MSALKFVDCTLDRHGAAILDIYNDAILNTTALYDYKTRTMDNMVAWFKEKVEGRYPVIGVVADDGTLLGFATYGMWRVRPAYKYTVEHSLYVHKKYRGKRIGDALLKAIVEAARAQDYHVIVGGIDAENAVSIKLHLKHGFVHAGTVTQSGFKFGRWLDVAFYQLTLPTPSNPVDG
jgi:L-amino acid N-acyltransferase YncA